MSVLTIDEQKLQQMLDSRFQASEAKLQQTLELELAKGLGQISQHFDKRFDKFEKRLDKRVDDLYGLLDGFTDRMDDDDVDRAAIINQQDRHGRWINELAGKTATKLSAP